MIESLIYEVWEPNYAWSKFNDSWCMQYTGDGTWEIKYRKNVSRGVAKWITKVSGDVDDLAAWARKSRGTDEDNLRKQFKILLTGSYEKRLKNLRTSLILLCTREHYETAGGVGTSFIVKQEMKIYAELGNNGGIDVWGRTRQKFCGETSIVHFANDCVSIVQVEEAIYDGGFNYSGKEDTDLQELLSCTKVGIPLSEAKQTFVKKPKGRPHRGGFRVCTSDEFDTQWHELDGLIAHIRDALKYIHAHNLKIDWYKLLDNQQQLMPQIWVGWARYIDCYKDMPSLITAFPCGWYTTKSTKHSMCSLTTFEYYVAQSHLEWFESCLAFVANRLEIVVESHEPKT